MKQANVAGYKPIIVTIARAKAKSTAPGAPPRRIGGNVPETRPVQDYNRPTRNAAKAPVATPRHPWKKRPPRRSGRLAPHLPASRAEMTKIPCHAHCLATV